MFRLGIQLRTMLPSMPVVVCVAILATIVLTRIALSSANDAKLFKPLLEPNTGSVFCGNETPSAVVHLADTPGFPGGVPEAVQCGMMCTGFSGCVGFNHRMPSTGSLDGQCELFTSKPQSCTMNDASCQYYQMSGQSGSCKRFDAFDRISGTNLFYKPIFRTYTWGDATKACLELSPFAHLVIFNTEKDILQTNNYLQAFPSTSVAKCNAYPDVRPNEPWYGYWTALRRVDVYTTDKTTCLNSPVIWVKDNTTSGQQPLWTTLQTTWQNLRLLQLDCTAYYYPEFPTETCFAIAPQQHDTTNDVNCWWPQCPLCQLDVD